MPYNAYGDRLDAQGRPADTGPVGLSDHERLPDLLARILALEAAGNEVLAADGARARREPDCNRRWDEALARLDRVLDGGAS